MGELKVNVTSTAIEKGLDSAKGFLDKLIMPSVEEVGLLMKDKVAAWRLSNQIKILNKAQEKCVENNISPKAISLKILCPYLEYASLEEDEYMQDKWANLLTNLVDSEQNIENNIFPYILSQISKNEYEILIYTKNLVAQNLNFNKEALDSINNDMNELAEIVAKKKASGEKSFYQELRKIEEYESFKNDTVLPGIYHFTWKGDKKYELENLIRLGLFEKVQKHLANAEIDKSELEIDKWADLRNSDPIINVSINSREYYMITDIGNLFIDACSSNSKD